MEKMRGKGKLELIMFAKLSQMNFNGFLNEITKRHDFGIDGLIEIVSSNGAVTGQIIAAQIKFGKSFFNEEGPLGYIYRGEF